MVKKARLEMKDENDLAWKLYPGRWNSQFINLRNKKIEENRMEFYRKTDWSKLKNDFDSDVVERKKQAQIHHTSDVFVGEMNTIKMLKGLKETKMMRTNKTKKSSQNHNRTQKKVKKEKLKKEK